MKQITTTELRQMSGKEGLILQGCGGDLQEWVDGINGMLTDDGILQNGSTFKDVSVFEHGDLTNLLFPMEGVDLDIGKLAIWRLQTHDNFAGTWASDYVENRLGGFTQRQATQDKPNAPLIGADGNVFNLLGIASRTLKQSGLTEQAQEMRDRVTSCGSYNEALGIMGEYVNIVSDEDIHGQGGMEMGQSY